MSISLRYTDELTTQSRFNLRDRLHGEIMSASQPLRDFRLSFAKFMGKILLRKVSCLENLTDALGYSERKLKLRFLIFGNSSKALSEQRILYHKAIYYISNVAR